MKVSASRVLLATGGVVLLTTLIATLYQQTTLTDVIAWSNFYDTRTLLHESELEGDRRAVQPIPASPATAMLAIPSSQTATCSWGARRRLAKTVCDDPKFKPSTNLTSALVNGAIANEDKRVYYCYIFKVGTKAANGFFSQLNDKRGVYSYPGYQPDNRQPSNDTSQFRSMKQMPVEKAMGLFDGFQRIVTVRHPLQRLVSAYYQVMVLWRNSRQNFTEWVRQSVLNEAKRNMHWLSFQESCYMCDMEYDYILKMENLDEEFPDLRREMGWSSEHEYPTKHLNPHFNHTVYKYDDMLADFEREQPELFQAVLEKYEMDMKMFGYTWENHRSGCHSDLTECC